MHNINFVAVFLAGCIFGLSNGLSPGPTLILVVSHTLQHNLKAGIKVASAPIIYGLIVIPISVYISIRLSEFRLILGAVSITGALYTTYLGVSLVVVKPLQLSIANAKPRSFWVGVIANFSSPYAYIFWFTVGGPFILKAGDFNISFAILFAFTYYFCLVSSKILVATIVEKSRFFVEKGYVYIMRFLGLLLILFAVFIIKDWLTLAA